MSPVFKVRELCYFWHFEFFGKIHFIGILLRRIEPLWNYFTSMSDADQLGLQEVFFASWENRIRLDLCLQISCEDVLNLPGNTHLLRSDER